MSIVDEYIKIAYRFPQDRPDYEGLIVPLVETEIRGKLASLEEIFRANAIKVAIAKSEVRSMRLVQLMPAEVEVLARKSTKHGMTSQDRRTEEPTPQAPMAAKPYSIPASYRTVWAKYNGKRVLPRQSKEPEPPQFFVYDGEPFHLSPQAAGLLDDLQTRVRSSVSPAFLSKSMETALQAIGHNFIDRGDEPFFDPHEFGLSPIVSPRQMEDILRQVYPELFAVLDTNPAESSSQDVNLTIGGGTIITRAQQVIINQSRSREDRPTSDEPADEIASLKRRLTQLRRNLLTVQEKCAEFIDPRSAPPDLKEAEKRLREEIAKVESQMKELEAR